MTVRGVLTLAVLTTALGLARADDVTTFRDDLHRTGCTSEKLSPPLALLWKFSTGEDRGISAQPLCVGKRVFFCALGVVYSLDADTGEMIWSYDTRFDIRATPLYLDGRLYVGTNNGDIHVLDTADESENRFIGKLTFKRDPVTATPVADGGTLYVVTQSGSLWMVDLKTLAPPERAIYKFEAGPKQALALQGSTLVFTGGDNRVYVWDVKNKRVLWAQRQGALVTAPVLSNESVVVGTRDGVRSLRLRSGTVEWERLGITSGNRAAPILRGDKVYVIDRGQALLGVLDTKKAGAVVATTAKDWPLPTDEAGTLADRDLYFGTIDGNLYALDADTLEAKWYYRCSPSETVGKEQPKYPVAAPPVVSNGNLLVLTRQGTLYCFRADAVDVGKPQFFQQQIVTLAVDGSPWVKEILDDELRKSLEDQAKADAKPGEEPKIPDDAKPLKLPGKQAEFRLETYLYDEGSGVDYQRVKVLYDGKPYEHSLIEARHDDDLLVVYLMKPGTPTGRQQIENGDHTITITAPDFKGNSVQRTFTFTIDNTMSLEPQKKKEPAPGPGGAGPGGPPGMPGGPPPGAPPPA